MLEDCRAELNFGVVALLAATLFIAIGISVVGYHIAGFVGDGPSTARLTVNEDSDTVTVTIHDLGGYDEVLVSYGTQQDRTTRPKDFEFHKTGATNTTLVIEGITKSGNKVIIRETTF